MLCDSSGVKRAVIIGVNENDNKERVSAPRTDEYTEGTPELSPRTFCIFPREWSSRRRTPRIVVEELSGVGKHKRHPFHPSWCRHAC